MKTTGKAAKPAKTSKVFKAINPRPDPIKTWQMKCPLKVFRIANEVTLTRAALSIGVSVTSLQFWESGTREPKPDNFKALASFMRAKCGTPTSAAAVKKTEAEWREWLESKPR